MDFQTTTEQKVHVKLSAKTAQGNDAKVDGTPVWTIESGEATVEPDPDGMGATFISGNSAGEATYRVTADADLGDGVRQIERTGKYTYVDPQAENLEIIAEEPVTK